MHAMARLENIRHHEADDQREGRHDLEVDQGLDPDAPNLAQVAHPADARDHGGEDDRGDQHLDELDEGVTEGLELRTVGRFKVTQCDAENDGDQDLNIEMAEDFHDEGVFLYPSALRRVDQAGREIRT